MENNIKLTHVVSGQVEFELNPSPCIRICIRSVLQWNRQSQNKHCQNCYNEITFHDWSTWLCVKVSQPHRRLRPLGQQSPLYDLMLTRSSKTRLVISLLAEVPSWDWLNLSYRVQRTEIGITLYVSGVPTNISGWNMNAELRSCDLILIVFCQWDQWSHDGRPME